MHPLYEPVAGIMRKVATEVILPHYRNLKASDIEEKSPGDFVTVADKLSEQRLSAELLRVLPQASIVGEEAAAADPDILKHINDKTAWIIDPIDGTGNFAAGKPPFGIIIALVEQGETIAGWLYDPLKERLCFAWKSKGAYINGEQVTANSEFSGKPIAALATGFMKEQKREQTLAKATPHYEIADIPRCAAEQYPRLVLGQNHVSIFERTLPWDHAAGILFLNEAGGRAARWDGSDYLPGDNRTGLLGASSPKLWDEAARIFS